MPNVAEVLKREMKRIASKELRSSGLESMVKAQQRRIRDLERRLKSLEARPAAPARTADTPQGPTFDATPANLKKLRARLGVTQPGLAKLVGVSASAVAKWESARIRPGQNAKAKLHALAAAAEAAPRSADAHSAPPAQGAGTPQPARGRRFKATPAVIKSVRGKLAITQGELAKLLGVSHGAVYQWEAGRLNPRAKTVAALQELKNAGKREVRRRLEAL